MNELLRPGMDFPYEIAEKVGEGSMGEVYRAFEPLLERTVAIKTIRPDYLAGLSEDDAQTTVQRFLQEARSAAALSHPGVATIYRVGTVETVPYMALEWLEGETLETRMGSREPMPLRQVVHVGVELLQTLAAAHRAGIVHRDIKPANLFLTRQGRLKVTDFGIARMHRSRLVQTQTGVFLGTPMYAAPEQFLGKAIDGRSDLYSVGVILYEALCGVPPHSSNDLFRLFTAVLHTEPEPPRMHNPQLPEALERVVLQALSKKPEQRYDDADVMLAALVGAAGELAQPALAASLSLPLIDAGAMTRQSEARQRTVYVVADSSAAMVSRLVSSWPGRQLGTRSCRELIARTLERPVHAEAFAGGIRLGQILLLVWEGLLLAALDTRSGALGDAVLEALPEQAAATLHPCPDGLTERSRIVKHLASLLLPPRVVRGDISSRQVDPGELARQLTREQFDGVLRLSCDGVPGLVLFSYGQRALELFAQSWPAQLRDGAWQSPGEREIVANVESLTMQLPLYTFRRELTGLRFFVRAPTPGPRRISRVREDEHSDRGRSALLRIYKTDPVHALQHWLLDELAAAFDPKRARRWRAMLGALDQVTATRWHDAPGAGRDEAPFDLSTFDADGHVLHVADLVALGSAAAIDSLVERARVLRETRNEGRELAAALLVAPGFDKQARARYTALVGQSAEGASGWLGSLQRTLSSAESVVQTRRGAFHLLLVEQTADGLRPLLPET